MKILIAEDEDDMANIYLEILQPRGHNVVIARDGRECLNKFLDEFYSIDKPDFDLVILDQVMPKISGSDVAREIIKEKPDQRIIFVSGYGDKLLDSLGDDFENIDFLTKPISLSALIDLVEKQVVA